MKGTPALHLGYDKQEYYVDCIFCLRRFLFWLITPLVISIFSLDWDDVTHPLSYWATFWWLWFSLVLFLKNPYLPFPFLYFLSLCLKHFLVFPWDVKSVQFIFLQHIFVSLLTVLPSFQSCGQPDLINLDTPKPHLC